MEGGCTCAENYPTCWKVWGINKGKCYSGATAGTSRAPSGCGGGTNTDCSYSFCAAGGYISGGRCHLCAKGKFGTVANAHGSASCSDCTAGHSCYYAGTRTPARKSCAHRRRAPAVASAHLAFRARAALASRTRSSMRKACTDDVHLISPPAACVAGTAASTGSQSCVACPAGKSTSSSQSSSCTSCAPGKHSPTSGSVMCFNCPLGTFSDTWSSTSCRACSAGTYSASPGQSACSPCAKGGYCPTPGAASALVYQQCAAGFYNPDTGSSSASACRACEAGKANPVPGSDSMSVCEDCLPGSIASGEGTGICTL